MVHAYIIVFSILIVEIIRYFKILDKFQKIFLTSKKILNVLKSKKISDLWKEKVTLKYSQQLFLTSFKILSIFFLLIIIFFIFNFIDNSFRNYLISAPGIIETSVVAFIYFYINKPINGNYSFVQKNLHHLVLGNKIINNSLFKIEQIVFLKKLNNIENKQHVFITGLPRSGTTILLEFLYKTNNFASLTYKDMPFILSPNLFSKFNSGKNFELKERMHGDNIKFNLQTPEAFDGVFFQNFEENEIRENLKIFISLVLKKYNKDSYLSKNNNNYNRIKLIRSILPKTKFIIPFREPLQHANSLLFQHNHFCKLQKKEKFILQYMNYLGHYEFGLNHKYWNMPKNYNNKFSLNYWLEQWLLFYKNLLDNLENEEQVIFISYENLCENKNIQNELLQKLDVKSEINFEFSLSQKKIVDDFDEKLVAECNCIQEKLVSLSLS